MVLKLWKSARFSGTLVLPRKCAPAALSRRTVTGSDVVSELRHTPRGGCAFQVVCLLDGDRQPVQRPQRPAMPEQLVSCACRLTRLVETAYHHSVERLVVLLDALNIQIRKLKRADLSVPDGLSQLGRRAEGQVGHRGDPR